MVTYSYDLAGRTTGVSDTSSSIASVATPGSTTTYATTYTYDALNRPNGLTWNPATTTPPLTQDLRSVTVGGATASRFLAVGKGGAVAYSDDGAGWLSASAGSSSDLADVLFAPGMYLAVGDAGANAVSK